MSRKVFSSLLATTRLQLPFGRYLAGTCVPPTIAETKIIKLHFMPCKAHNLKLYPYTLIPLNDRQTTNKEFPVVAILLQGSLETLF
jgi:hypothetical protein